MKVLRLRCGSESSRPKHPLYEISMDTFALGHYVWTNKTKPSEDATTNKVLD